MQIHVAPSLTRNRQAVRLLDKNGVRGGRKIVKAIFDGSILPPQRDNTSHFLGLRVSPSFFVAGISSRSFNPDILFFTIHSFSNRHSNSNFPSSSVISLIPQSNLLRHLISKMPAIATLSKATATALVPFMAVYYWPKEPAVFSYTLKNQTAPLIAFPRPSNLITQAKEGHLV